MQHHAADFVKYRKIFKNGAPKRSRTPNLQIRSLTLYPIELWVRDELFIQDYLVKGNNKVWLIID
jgi:hypothetical protein